MSYRYKLIDTHAPRYPAGKFSSLPYALTEPDYWICTDCLMVLENGDSSGVPDELLADVLAGVKDFPPVCYSGDDDTDRDFSSRWCDCCRSMLAGSRYGMTEIQEVGWMVTTDIVVYQTTNLD